MKKMISLSFVAGILVTLSVPILMLAMGAINMGADVNPGLIERTLAPWGRDRSVEKRAPKERNPYAGDPGAIAAGFGHYRENCIMCHGAPGVAGAELSRGSIRPPPRWPRKSLTRRTESLFWVVKHGIRMTAMPAFGPTHTDAEIWTLVAFIRHLPDLTPQERDSLRAATGEHD